MTERTEQAALAPPVTGGSQVSLGLDDEQWDVSGSEGHVRSEFALRRLSVKAGFLNGWAERQRGPHATR